MSVTVSGGFGISPVLLQAVSSLTSAEGAPEQDRHQQSAMEKQQVENRVVSHLLQGMHEPVAQLLTTSKSSSNISSANSSRVPTVTTRPDESVLNAAIQERLASQLALKQGKIVEASSGKGYATTVSSDVSMVNILTALASHHAKTNIKQEVAELNSTSSVTLADPMTMTTPAAEVIVQPTSSSTEDRSQPQIIIYYTKESEVPSASGNVVVRDMELAKVQGDVQNYQVVLHHGDATGATVTTLPQMPGPEQPVQVVAGTAGAVAGKVMSDGKEVFCDPDSSDRELAGSVCPVCGDKISGYHYGVYTCESCKGFFKRTVQNKKAFMCHKQGKCEVVLQNRKKCPACRYTKCLAVGMKLEAIRQDRTRGGRSTYNGSPYLKPKPSPVPKKTKQVRIEVRGAEEKTEGAQAFEDGRNHQQLAAILNHRNTHDQQLPDAQDLPVPELLIDILNLEAILADEDIPLETAGDVTEEQVFYNHLMQLTELRLYKLVRWARNLPQFGAISTDDQIVLLQNCWSDLLALGVCWKSVRTPNVLIISSTQSISQERAEALGFGDVVERLLSITQSLQGLQVDQYEYVALKVLLLISPDVKGLKEPHKIQEYQEKLSDALFEYTSSHYAHMPAKYGEMLLRLPELARISFLAREILLVALPPSMKSCGLLVELLRGENAAKD